MKSFFKTQARFFLLFAGCIPFAFSIFFLAKQQYIHHTMKERMELEALKTILLPAGQLHWVEEKKEIIIEGRFFDVKSVSFSQGKYILTGLYDDEETMLMHQLGFNTRNKQESGTRLLEQFFCWLQSVYADARPGYLNIPDHIKQSTPYLTGQLHPPYKDILTPPPQS